MESLFVLVKTQDTGEGKSKVLWSRDRLSDSVRLCVCVCVRVCACMRVHVFGRTLVNAELLNFNYKAQLTTQTSPSVLLICDNTESVVAICLQRLVPQGKPFHCQQIISRTTSDPFLSPLKREIRYSCTAKSGELSSKFLWLLSFITPTSYFSQRFWYTATQPFVGEQKLLKWRHWCKAVLWVTVLQISCSTGLRKYQIKVKHLPSNWEGTTHARRKVTHTCAIYLKK